MSTLENLYEMSGDTIIILRKRFLSFTDNNFCAAFLLDRFVAEIATREEYAMFGEGPLHYRIEDSVRHLTAQLLGLFEASDVVEALNLLIDKQLIGNHGKVDGYEDRYIFEIHRKKINELTEAHWQQIRSQHVQLEVKQQVDPTPAPPQPTPEELARQERDRILARELDRVKSHNTRASRVHLPATLTLEEWLETLEYFAWKCAYCEGEYSLLEHYVPLSHYGGTTKDNCVPACHGCNGVKQAWHPDRIPYTAKRNSKKLQNGIVRVKEYLQSIREVGEQ